MEVFFRVSGKVLIASIRGEVDHHSAAHIRSTIDRSIKAFGCKDLILDMSGVEFMDSAGIGVALGRYKKLKRSGGRVCICGCSDYIDKLLKMADVFSVIPKAEDTEAAVAMLGGQEQLRMEV